MNAKLIEDVLPPIIYRFLLRVYLSIRGLGWHRFYGCYLTLADVPNADEQNSEWYVAKSAQQVESLKPEISRTPMGDDAGLLLLPLAVSQLLRSDGVLTVLDFGGGPAHGLKEILEHVPSLDLSRFRYVLIETPAMCKAIGQRLAEIQKQRFAGNRFIELADAIPAFLPGPLIVHARASLHYVPDYRVALSRLLGLAPDAFIVAHTLFTEAPTFAQEQRNHPHRTLARWVFNRDEFVSEIERFGYCLIFSYEHDLPIIHKNSRPLNRASIIFNRMRQ